MDSPARIFAIYTRVSTDDQARAKEGSLTSQEQRRIACELTNINHADEQLRPSRIIYRIQQKEKDVLKVGKFTTFNDQQVDSVEFTVLLQGFSRALMPKYKPGVSQYPLCRSSTGMEPDGGDKPESGPCMKRDEKGRLVPACPKAKWIGNGKGQKSDPPECSEVYTWLCYDHKQSLPFIFKIKRSAISSASKLKTLVLASGIDHIFLRCSMTTKLVKSEAKDYYIPVFATPTQLDSETVARLFSIAKSFRDGFDLGAVMDEDEDDSDDDRQEVQPVATPERKAPASSQEMRIQPRRENSSNGESFRGKLMSNPKERFVKNDSKRIVEFVLLLEEVIDQVKVVCWEEVGYQADGLHKGDMVHVRGKRQMNSWTDKKGEEHSETIIEAFEIIVLDAGGPPSAVVAGMVEA